MDARSDIIRVLRDVKELHGEQRCLTRPEIFQLTECTMMEGVEAMEKLEKDGTIYQRKPGQYVLTD